MSKTQSTRKEKGHEESRTVTITTTTTQLPGLEGIEVIRSFPRYTKESSQESSSKK